MKGKIYIVALIMLISCNDKKAVIEEKLQSVDSFPVIENVYKEDKNNNKQEFTSIDKLLKILENKEKLNPMDYNSLLKHIKSNNESVSEGLGYLIFDYFYKDDSKNQEISLYLQSLDISQQNKYITCLLKIMCLEISINEYNNFNSFVQDFTFISSNNELYKKVFYECLSNQTKD